jgi:glutaredoxin-like YruB-family protein
MEVTVYSTPTCPWCIKVKEFLKEHKIEFKSVDVAADQEKAREMVEKSGQMGVPVTEIDGQIVIGYDEAKLKKLLKIK